MSEFDDPELERLLGRAGGAFPDVNTAYSRVQGRVRQVKRRRMMVATTAACGVLFAGAVLAAGRGNDSRTLQPGGSSDLSAPDTSGITDSTTGDSTDDSTVASVDDTTATSTDNSSVDTTVDGSNGGSTPSSTPGTTPVTQPTTAPTQPTTPATNPVSETKTFSGVGGSLTVKLQNGSLSIIGGPTPAAGFTVRIDSSGGSRVEVRFQSDSHETRIRVEIANGAISLVKLEES
ncbi:MAG: hypothetical protein Q7V88_12615 [Actinomycetota bacterium]|nr:hypothetical protein [Actinomycetota bacterium]